MKICMVTGLAGPGSVAGGVWEVVVNQSQALVASGHEVSIVAGWLGSDPPRELRGLSVELVPVQPLLKRLGLRGLVGRGWREAVERASAGASVAHVHLCRDYLTMSATQMLARLDVPVVAQTHGMLKTPSNPAFAAFDLVVTQPSIRSVKHFITLTEAEKVDLMGFGLSAGRLTTIGNAVPEPHRTWSPDPGPQRLLFVSRLHPRKQVMVFAEVVTRLCASGFDVTGIVAGPDQGDLPRLLSFIEQGKHQDHLAYIGEVDRARLIDELAAATAFVLPARHEPFGLVLIEAMAVGTPVISTNETPLADAIASFGAGVVSSPDVHSLTAELTRLLTDTRRLAALSFRGRAFYESDWTNETMVERLINLYDLNLSSVAAP